MGKRWKEKLFSLFTAWVLVILPLTAIPAAAQATTGTLRGVVVDPNGGVVVGASVTAKNEATGTVASPVTTTGEGIFEFASLLPGTYTVTVESTGFKRSVSTGVNVKVGIVNPVNIKLEAGSVQETVTVVANTEEVVQREQSQISTTVDTRRVEELPSNAAGSGLDTLALLAPGVIPNNSGGVNTNGTGLSVNGNRARSNNFQIDGSDNNDLSVAGPAMFVDNQDQVQEIQVITNNFSAQYGRNQGAIVNYVTKSGTNNFHGSAFEFHRDNSFLDSLDNIEKRGGQLAPNPSLFNVFGGTVGGPLPIPHFGEGGKGWHSGKDRAFFFVSYQGIRNPSTTTLRDSTFAFLPSQFPLLRAAFPGNAVINAITTQSVFAVASNAHPRTDVANPIQTVTLNGQNFLVAQPEYTISTPFTETDYSMRFDFKASNKDNVTVRYEHQRQLFVNALAGNQLNGFSGDVPASSKNFGGIWTRTINNSMVSEFRAFYQKIGVEFGGCSAISAGCIPSPLQIGSAITNIALPKLNGLTLQSIGPLNVFPQGRDGKVYQVADNLSWTHGKHNFIFGAEYKHLNEVSPFLPNFNGVFGFSSATRLINNAPSSISLTAGDPTLAFTENDQYYFVQDDWKIRPNLTLNLGVRYEYTGQPINVLNRVTVARESNPATAFFDPSLPLSVRTVPAIPADKNNFAPRVGFAYTPHFWKSILGEDATVIRGGYSIAYEPAFYNILQNVQNTAPFSAALVLGTNLLPATNSPFPLPGALTGDAIRSAAASSGVLPLGRLDPRFLAQNIVSPNFHSPYSEQWSLGVQHQFGKNNVAEVRYVGTHGIGLFQNVNGNFFVGPLLNGIPNWEGTGVNMPAFPQFVPPGVTAQHCVDNPATPSNEGACNGRILPQGSLTIRENSAFSIYHAMQARYNGRFLNNALTLGAAYTWSRTEDNASEIFANDIASANAQNPFCITTCEKARSQIDRPHAFSLNFLYDIPFMKEQRGFVGRALGGWQVNGVYVLASGQPYTPGQFFNSSVYGLGNAYLTSGDRPFVGNPNADQRLVALSQLDAELLYGVPVQNVNGFYSLNALNSQTDASGNPLAVPVSPNDVRFIVNTPNAARIFGTPFGSAGRNILRGPALNQLNASLFKNIKIKENLSVQLRGEAYNVLNHPNPGYGVNQAGYCPGCNAGFSGATGSLFVEDAGNPGSAFANNQDIELARRVIQLGIRIIF